MTAAEQVERAVQRHLEHAEYRFDCEIADLLRQPRPESPEERRRRELLAGWSALGSALGAAAAFVASVVKAFGDAFSAAVEEGTKQG